MSQQLQNSLATCSLQDSWELVASLVPQGGSSPSETAKILRLSAEVARQYGVVEYLLWVDKAVDIELTKQSGPVTDPGAFIELHRAKQILDSKLCRYKRLQRSIEAVKEEFDEDELLEIFLSSAEAAESYCALLANSYLRYEDRDCELDTKFKLELVEEALALSEKYAPSIRNKLLAQKLKIKARLSPEDFADQVSYLKNAAAKGEESAQEVMPLVLAAQASQALAQRQPDGYDFLEAALQASEENFSKFRSSSNSGSLTNNQAFFLIDEVFAEGGNFLGRQKSALLDSMKDLRSKSTGLAEEQDLTLLRAKLNYMSKCKDEFIFEESETLLHCVEASRRFSAQLPFPNYSLTGILFYIYESFGFMHCNPRAAHVYNFLQTLIPKVHERFEISDGLLREKEGGGFQAYYRELFAGLDQSSRANVSVRGMQEMDDHIAHLKAEAKRPDSVLTPASEPLLYLEGARIIGLGMLATVDEGYHEQGRRDFENKISELEGFYGKVPMLPGFYNRMTYFMESFEDEEIEEIKEHAASIRPELSTKQGQDLAIATLDLAIASDSANNLFVQRDLFGEEGNAQFQESLAVQAAKTFKLLRATNSNLLKLYSDVFGPHSKEAYQHHTDRCYFDFMEAAWNQGTPEGDAVAAQLYISHLEEDEALMHGLRTGDRESRRSLKKTEHYILLNNQMKLRKIMYSMNDHSAALGSLPGLSGSDFKAESAKLKKAASSEKVSASVKEFEEQAELSASNDLLQPQTDWYRNAVPLAKFGQAMHLFMEQEAKKEKQANEVLDECKEMMEAFQPAQIQNIMNNYYVDIQRAATNVAIYSEFTKRGLRKWTRFLR